MNTTNSTSESMQIVGGPSAAELIDAFKYAFDKSREFRISFKTRGGKLVLEADKERFLLRTFSVQITGLGYESGTPGMLLFTGNITGGLHKTGAIKGFYDASQRGGWFRYVR
jgi:hypothetical protein